MLIGIEKMKKDSRDDDLDAEAHIRRLKRDMEDFSDGKDTGICCENGASSSPFPSLLYSHSAIASDAVTYTLFIQAIAGGRREDKAVSALDIPCGMMLAKYWEEERKFGGHGCV